MRRFILAATAITALAALALPALASADVQRYQTEHATLTTTLTQLGYVHTYSIDINPSNGTFTGTGNGAYPDGTTFSNEAIKGTLSNGNVTFTATYQPTGVYPGYQWGVTNASLGTQATMWDSWGEQLPVTTKLSDVTVSPKNHGDYVSSQGGGADAAHSDIGMPTNSSK